MKTSISFLEMALLILLGIGCQERSLTSDAGSTLTDVVQGSIDPGEMVKRGAYLVQVIGCSDCHTPLKMTEQGPAPDMDRFLSGHPGEISLPAVNPEVGKDYVLFNMTNTAVIGPWGTSYSANLTPDETGLGNWSEAQFTRAMQEGKSKGLENGRPLLPPMPWQNYSMLEDQDIKAIYAYLQTIKPVHNPVPAPLFPAALSMK